MTTWLITGAGGMLGQDLVRVLRDYPSVTVTAVDRAGLDLSDPDAVARAVAGHDVVINAAAWTNVDGAEADEAAATEINGQAVAHLARCCAAARARLLHVSTDYVFAGDASSPYQENAPTKPINAYGRSKLVGEEAILRVLPELGYVVRSAWLYGEHGRNFVSTMLRLAADRPTVDVVDDQRGQPTWSYALARRLVELGGTALRGAAPAGIYHATASGETTWYGLARAAYTAVGLDPDRVRPTTSEAYPLPAPRPAYSVLGHDRWAEAGLGPMAPWDESLAQALTRPAFAEFRPAAQRS
jgi:dTDP-4-dehydrorhamnose reductase